MKKISLFLLLSGLIMTAQAQSKSVEALYNKYQSDKNFFHMDLAGNFLNFAQGMNLTFDEANLEAITQSVERVKLFKLPVDGQAAKADLGILQRGLEKEKFEIMMELSEKSNEVTMYSKGGNKIKDIVLLIYGLEEHMVIALEGEFDAKRIAQAGQKVRR